MVVRSNHAGNRAISSKNWLVVSTRAPHVLLPGTTTPLPPGAIEGGMSTKVKKFWSRILVSECKLLSMKAALFFIFVFTVCALISFGGQNPSPRDSRSYENAAVKYLRADASLRQSYELPPDATAKLEKKIGTPLDVEDERLVSAAEEALVEFHHGASSQRCDWVMSVEDGPLATTAHRGAIRELVAVATIRARLRFRDGNTPGAIDDLLAAMAAARHLSLDGSIASVLFANKLEITTAEVLAQNLSRFSPTQLNKLLTSLDTLPSGSDFRTALEAEKLNRDDLLTVVQGAQNTKELSKHLLRDIPALQSNAALAAQVVEECGGSVKGYENCVVQQHAFYASWTTRFNLSPEQFEKAYKSEYDELSKTNAVVRQFTPAMPRLRWAEAYEQTRRALLRAVVAVQIDGPRALSRQLDPYDKMPFTYSPVDRGFRLESRLSQGGVPISLTSH